MNQDNRIARRKFIKLAGLTATAGAGLGFTSFFGKDQISGDKSESQHPQVHPVNVSAGRVIRTVVGLRPYRASGFVVRAERVNNKTVIHNYGHGGAGITLSWGSAKLAVDLALQTNQKKFAVLGSGVMGLSTARLLQKRGFDVTIYTKALPPETTSNIAGGMWFPTTVFDKTKVDTKFLSQFDEACRISYRTFQDYVGGGYGVWWMPEYSLGTTNAFPSSLDFYRDIQEHRDAKTHWGYDYVQEYTVMMIEPPIYLNALLRDFYQAGGKLKVKAFESAAEVSALAEPVIMNCTGLGAAKLFNDKELIPVRGQLSILIPQPEIDYSYSGEIGGTFIYMLPRKDGIVLGGTFQEGNASLDPSEQDSDVILKAHAIVTKAMGG